MKNQIDYKNFGKSLECLGRDKFHKEIFFEVSTGRIYKKSRGIFSPLHFKEPKENSYGIKEQNGR